MKIIKKRREKNKNMTPISPANLMKPIDLSKPNFEGPRPQRLMSPEEGFPEGHLKFTLFLKAIYEDALAHPERLRSSKEVWEGAEELVEGVQLGEDD